MSNVITACILFYLLLPSSFVTPDEAERRERRFAYGVTTRPLTHADNGTSILFYGDDVFFYGHAQENGFIKTFEREILKFLRSIAEDPVESSRNLTRDEGEETKNIQNNSEKGNDDEKQVKRGKKRRGKKGNDDEEIVKRVNERRRVSIKKEHTETKVSARQNSVFAHTTAHVKEGYDLFHEILNYTSIPTIMILQFGMNDVMIDHSPPDNFEYFEFYLGAIIEKALSMGIEIVICSPTLYGDDVHESHPKNLALERITGVVTAIAKKYDVTFLDLFTTVHKFHDKYNVHRHKRHVLTLDGITLNDAGNHILAGQLLNLFGIHYAEASPHKILENHLLLKSVPFEASHFCKKNTCGDRSERVESIEPTSDSNSSTGAIDPSSDLWSVVEEDLMFS